MTDTSTKAPPWLGGQQPSNRDVMEAEAWQRGYNCGRAEARREALELGYLLGFKASGEGWNGEYPYAQNNASPTTDAYWINLRDNALRALIGEGE